MNEIVRGSSTTYSDIVWLHIISMLLVSSSIWMLTQYFVQATSSSRQGTSSRAEGTISRGEKTSRGDNSLRAGPLPSTSVPTGIDFHFGVGLHMNNLNHTDTSKPVRSPRSHSERPKKVCSHSIDYNIIPLIFVHR